MMKPSEEQIGVAAPVDRIVRDGEADGAMSISVLVSGVSCFLQPILCPPVLSVRERNRLLELAEKTVFATHRVMSLP